MQFHAGEIAVQAQAGVREEAKTLHHLISNLIKPAAQIFLSTQQLAIASTVDTNGRVWASLLTGEPGFVKVLNQQTVQVDAISVPSDPLHHNLHGNNQIGLLVIDLTNRKRLRLNGQAEIQPQRQINITIEQAFFNCPKYIQARHLELETTESSPELQISIAQTLSTTHQNLIAQADTFFIGSYAQKAGADASHRGGFPGFVQVLNSNKLVFPDYAGNNMFQTLGNFAVNPQAGLLFINFTKGHILQLTGTVKVIWKRERLTSFAGAQRLVEFDIEQIIETQNATLLRWRFGSYSPANPSFDE
jgi:uncharacterized protein